MNKILYDIIGDIHGHASALENLLIKLGYTEKKDGWQKSSRKVIFLGDFIDRGPEQIKTLEIVKKMVENNHALAVMGNHEFNAVAWATEDKQKSGTYLRPHTDKNYNQHAKFLTEIKPNSTRYLETIAWFKQLPLYLELEGLRVIHACWHPTFIKLLKPYLDTAGIIKKTAWPDLCKEGTPQFNAIETLLKGIEIPLPVGIKFKDKDGNIRQKTRVRWWLKGDELTYQDIALVPNSVIKQIPNDVVPQTLQQGYDQAKPLFIGHYWMQGRPTLISHKIACVDWSIAAQDAPSAKLSAYRWNGEIELSSNNFIWVNY